MDKPNSNTRSRLPSKPVRDQVARAAPGAATSNPKVMKGGTAASTSADRAQAAVRAAWDAYAAERSRRDEAEADHGLGMAGLRYYQEVHPLWTAAMAAVVPSLSAVDGQVDPLCYYRFVAPHRRDCQWFVLGAQQDGGDVRLLVYASLADPENAEVGYIMLSELRSIRGPFLLNVETDPDWEPTPLSEVEKMVQS